MAARSASALPTSSSSRLRLRSGPDSRAAEHLAVTVPWSVRHFPVVPFPFSFPTRIGFVPAPLRTALTALDRHP